MKARVMRKASLLDFVIWFYLALFALWLFFRLFFFDANWVLALINDSTVYYFAPLVLLIPLALRKRHVRLLLGLSIPFVIFLALYGVRFLPKPALAAAPSMKVMSFNTLFNNPDYDSFVAAITQISPDLLGMQEVSQENANVIESRLAAQYPYRLVHSVNRSDGEALLSRYPIQDNAILPNPPFDRAMHATVLIHRKPISVYVVHLAPPNMLSYPRDQFVSLAEDRYSARRAQVEYMRNEIATHTLPTFVLCDCNMSDGTWTYAVMREVLDDSYPERGWGLGFTLMAPMPILTERYDYVWHTPELTAIDAFVGPYGGSDHIPVVATFALPQ